VVLYHPMPLARSLEGTRSVARTEGYRRLHALLEPASHAVNVKRVARLYVEERLMVLRCLGYQLECSVAFVEIALRNS